MFSPYKLIKSWGKGRTLFISRILCLPAKSETLCSTSHRVISTGNASMAE